KISLGECCLCVSNGVQFPAAVGRNIDKRYMARRYGPHGPVESSKSCGWLQGSAERRKHGSQASGQRLRRLKEVVGGYSPRGAGRISQALKPLALCRHFRLSPFVDALQVGKAS